VCHRPKLYSSVEPQNNGQTELQNERKQRRQPRRNKNCRVLVARARLNSQSS